MALPLVLHPASRAPLSELTPSTAEAWAAENQLPRYRGRQLAAALTKRAIQSLDELTEWPSDLRRRVAAEYRVRAVGPRLHLTSADGAEKVLFELADGATVETVLIPSRQARGRTRLTVCVSSQVGCPAACSFCATGLGGFSRNLTGPEIADQVMYFVHQLRSRDQRVTNVVFMGMGEPLLNTRAVRDSIARLNDPAGFNLGERHITLSTVGIVPQLRRFTEWAGQVNLAVSLHAPNDELRSQLVPYNQRFPIASLLHAVSDYVRATRRRVSFEYVLLRGVNDAPHLAAELAELLRPLGGLAHVNLIPWNPFREGEFVRSEGPDAAAFAELLRTRGVKATIRVSRGLDISAACGQLRESARL